MSGLIVVYRGLVNVSLGVMSRDCIPIVTPHLNNLEVTEGTLIRPPVSLEMEYDWYDGLAKRSSAGTDDVFSILLHDNDSTGFEYIGHTGLHHITWPDGRANTGSIIFKQDLLRRGYGTEAKLLLGFHAFRVKGLRKLTSEVKAFNARSLGHLIKCGYTICGRRKQQHFHNGSFVDEILLELFREDWECLWSDYERTKTLPSLTDEQRALVSAETCA